MGGGTGGAVLVHVRTNNAEKEGTLAIVGKYRRSVKTLKEAQIGQIVLSGILPVMGGRGVISCQIRSVTVYNQFPFRNFLKIKIVLHKQNILSHCF